MRPAVKTCTLDMPYEAMLDFCAATGQLTSIRALKEALAL